MALPRCSIKNFLIHAKSTLRTAIAHKDKVTLVIGNESADLDSLTSSLLYAYIRSLTSRPPTLYIPITNIPRADLSLRPEFTALLPHASLTPSHLITLSDILPDDGNDNPTERDLERVKEGLPPEKTRWVLVDHNVLQGVLGRGYGDRVVGVVDHHDDEGRELLAARSEEKKEPRVIEKVGSCTSLVTRVVKQAWDQLGIEGVSREEENPDVWDAEVAKLAVASVCVDTSNLTSKEKTEECDRQAVEYLERKIKAVDAGWDRGVYFAEINKAKKDIGGLKLADILRKDYKQWSEGSQEMRLGISSVVKPLPFLREKAVSEAGQKGSSGSQDAETFNKALRAFADERRLDIFAVMTTSTSSSGNFQRELLIWALHESAVASAKKFAAEAADELGLEDWSDGDGRDMRATDSGSEWRKIWHQREVGKSRKQVAPLLRKAIVG